MSDVSGAPAPAPSPAPTPAPTPAPAPAPAPAPKPGEPAPAPKETALAKETPAKVALGAEDAKADAEKAALFGAPAEGKYAAFTLPDGYSVDESATKAFLPLATKLGLSQAGAQEVVNLYSQLQQEQAKTWQTQVEAWGMSASSDKEFGGTQYSANLATANRAIREFGTPELRQSLQDTGLGNHPEFIRFAYRVGRAMNEARAKTGQDASTGQKRTAAEVLYGNPNQGT